jgi:hypothetical protein
MHGLPFGVKLPDAKTFAVTLQTLAATPIGIWTVVFVSETLTRPCWLVLPPPPPPPPEAEGVLVAVHGPPFGVKLFAAITFAVTLQIFAATATGT